MRNMRLLWNIVDDSTVLFSTVLAHGEMLWFCRVLAWAWEKDAKKWKFAKNLVQNAEFLLSSGDFPSLMKLGMGVSGTLDNSLVVIKDVADIMDRDTKVV